MVSLRRPFNGRGSKARTPIIYTTFLSKLLT
jgi:hypothetical protein